MPSFILVQPMAQPAMTSSPAPISRPAAKSAARNLFGSCPKGSVDEELRAQNESTNEYLEARYNLNLKKLDEKWDQQIAEKLTSKQVDQVEQKCPTALSYARLKGIKVIFRVRKLPNGRSKKLKRKQSQNSNMTNNNNNNSHTE